MKGDTLQNTEELLYELLRKTEKDYFSKGNPNIYPTINTFGKLLSRICQIKETL